MKRRVCLWARATPNAATPADELLTYKKTTTKMKKIAQVNGISGLIRRITTLKFHLQQVL